MGFHIANEPAADQVLDEHPFAVVVGMMLDQQYGMEHAFRGGHKVLSRFGTLDPGGDRRRRPRRVQGDGQHPTGDPSLPRVDGSSPARSSPPSSRTATTAT